MTSVTNPEPHMIALAGEIDLHESPHLKEHLNPLIEKKLPRLFVDLSDVTYIDSSGLALFIDAMQRVHAYGGELFLFGIRESVRQIFEIARLDQVFKIYPNKEAALKTA